jgi:NADPH-dependent 2,4-dienoyl-CoA reductase/sulfur reductase-like enzyme
VDRTSHVVIVGASVAGLTTAEALRSEGFGGDITLVGEETHPPYGRPPLSKKVLLGDWAPELAVLRDRPGLDAVGVRFLPGTKATALDLTFHTVTAGRITVPYDRLVIATGAVARRLPGAQHLAGVHTLRTLDDVVALRADLAGARRVVVIGGGILGSEIAAATRTMGLDVTLVGRSRRLGFGHAGELLSEPIVDLHRAHGVNVCLGVGVAQLSGESRVSAVVLSDGSVVDADIVIVAIGGVPATEWLRDSGLDLSDGVVCDADGTASPGVYAIGDVAAWRDAGGVPLRAEHQSNALEQAQAVAHLIVTGEGSAPIVPFFWSELFGARIQAFGRFDADSPLELLEGDPHRGRFVAASVRGDRTIGVVGWNAPREFRAARARVLSHLEAAAIACPESALAVPTPA